MLKIISFCHALVTSALLHYNLDLFESSASHMSLLLAALTAHATTIDG